MKNKVAWLLLSGLLLAAVAIAAQGAPKLWVHKEYGGIGSYDNYVSAYYIEDRETGTRCYGITVAGSGAAISCVPKASKP